MSRADLIEALWDSRIYIDDNTLSVNVTRLRNKLGSWGCRSRSRPGGEWGISMTIADFLSDRLGRIVLQGGARRPPPSSCWPPGHSPAWWLCS